MTIRLCDAYFANGRVGREYLERMYGVSDTRIFNQFLSIDVTAIETRARMKRSKLDIRQSLGLPLHRRIVLFCGYLIPRKRIDLMILAVSSFAPDRRPVVLIVGRGPLQSQLQDLAARLAVTALFVGFHEGEELADYYLASDAFVLPSDDEPWGLVINEAMAASLPVICSDACGAAGDLVQDGTNGYRFRVGDASSLHEKLSLLLSKDLEPFSRASLNIIRQWTPTNSAESLAHCVMSVLPS
jgi:glycosyltransferase involved in cell wall biosynthesis